MADLTCIKDYLKTYGPELGHRVVDQFPPLHKPSHPVWPALDELKRNPFPAQALAIMGIGKRWEEARCAAAVAECGTGKTLISLGSVFRLPFNLSSAFGRGETCATLFCQLVKPQHSRGVVASSAFRERARASSGKRGLPEGRGVTLRESCRRLHQGDGFSTVWSRQYIRINVLFILAHSPCIHHR